MKPLSESELTQLEEVAKGSSLKGWMDANPETILRLLNMCKKVNFLMEALEFYAMEEYRPMQFMPWTLARAAISAYKEQ